MENENIRVSAFLASIVRKKLNEMGIQCKNEGPIFTKEELDLITAIEIDGEQQIKIANMNGGLEGLEYFSNLESFTIASNQDSCRLTSAKIVSINDKEVERICKCTSLKTLKIHNQTFVEDIDVSKLENLEELVISYNAKLESVKGLDKLKKLETLAIHGNDRLFKIEGLNNIIVNNNDIDSLALDVRLFPDAIGFNKDTGKCDKKALEKIVDNLGDNAVWCEAVNGVTPSISSLNNLFSKVRILDYGIIRNNTAQMIRMHNKACKILEENVVKNTGTIKDTLDIVVGVENYLAQNVTYDYYGVEHGHVSDKGSPARDFTNGAYNALVYNSAVCEGFTHAMQYLLKLRGIRTHNVVCFGVLPPKQGENETEQDFLRRKSEYEKEIADARMHVESAHLFSARIPLNHSIICINDRYYADPTWNSNLYQAGDKSFPYMLCSKEQISRDHILSPLENDIELNPTIRPTNNAIQNSIDSNDAFKKSKISDVKGVFGKIQTYMQYGTRFSVKEGTPYEL